MLKRQMDMRELDLEDKDRVQGGAIDSNRSLRVR
jgi:hypothetical protein